MAPMTSCERRWIARLKDGRERSFALVLDRGGMRRTWLRGGDNVHKRI